MLSLDYINLIVVVLVSIVIICCSIGIIVASKFQNKQKKKYNDCVNLINEKENAIFQIKSGLSKEEINKIDSDVDVDSLMIDLYNTYLAFEKKVNTYDSDLDNVLTGYIKEFYLNKIENFKAKGYSDIKDGIDLINYSITEFSKNKLKFRLTINCFSYKKVNGNIVSGSNLEKIETVLILTYEKQGENWLISNYEKVSEKKLSE